MKSNQKEETVLTRDKAVLDRLGRDVFVPYRFTVPLLLFACFGILALLFAIYLKALDKKKNYGLEAPNIKPE